MDRIEEANIQEDTQESDSKGDLMSSEQASYIDTEIEEVEKPYQEKVDNTNTVSLVKKIDKIAKR